MTVRSTLFIVGVLVATPANATFTDRQIGIERRRDAEQLELRSRRGGGALTPSAGLPVPATATAPTTPITPTEASGATVTR